MVLGVLCFGDVDSICILANEFHFCKVRKTPFKSDSEEDWIHRSAKEG